MELTTAMVPGGITVGLTSCMEYTITEKFLEL